MKKIIRVLVKVWTWRKWESIGPYIFIGFLWAYLSFIGVAVFKVWWGWVVGFLLLPVGLLLVLLVAVSIGFTVQLAVQKVVKWAHDEAVNE